MILTLVVHKKLIVCNTHSGNVRHASAEFLQLEVSGSGGVKVTFVYITDKSKVETSQNFVAFSEYMNFINDDPAGFSPIFVQNQIKSTQLKTKPEFSFFSTKSRTKIELGYIIIVLTVAM